MVNDFLKYIEENNLVRKGDRILAAVSGGIDSMVMVDLLLKTGLLSGIAHCNFRLRGKESGMDERMVRNYAARNSIPFHSIRFKTKDFAIEQGISIEMAARELRYDWFRKIMNEEGYSSVAVAHNLNDNIETLLLNLVRGTGIAGLTGMKPETDNIIRPLLFATRKSIEEYSKKNKISFREDSTNADTNITRNKIRHKVIPVLREINPSVDSTLNETAERLRGIYGILTEEMMRIRNSIFRAEDDIVRVNISQLKPYLPNRTFLFELFRPFGLTGSLTGDLLKIVKGRTGGQIFTGTHRILKNRNEMLISRQSADEDRTFVAASLEELKICPLIEEVRTISSAKRVSVSDDPAMAYLDHMKISFPVIIRKWQSGDFFYPFGMNRNKKLSDFFIDSKFSRLEKENAFIMETGGDIVWIIGRRIDNRFRITDSTQKVLVLKARSS